MSTSTPQCCHSTHCARQVVSFKHRPQETALNCSWLSYQQTSQGVALTIQDTCSQPRAAHPPESSLCTFRRWRTIFRPANSHIILVRRCSHDIQHVAVPTGLANGKHNAEADASQEPTIKAVKAGMTLESATFPFKPFSYGPRDCPGQRLGLIQVHSTCRPSSRIHLGLS